MRFRRIIVLNQDFEHIDIVETPRRIPVALHLQLILDIASGNVINVVLDSNFGRSQKEARKDAGQDIHDFSNQVGECVKSLLIFSRGYNQLIALDEKMDSRGLYGHLFSSK